MLHTRVSLAVMMALISGCGDSVSVDREIRLDSLGIEIITAPMADRVLTWTLQREREMGGAPEGPEMFHDVRRGLVDVDESGGLYILDRTGFQVISFDSSGRARWSAGGRGGGPGEFSWPISISVSPEGMTYVHDANKRALHQFDKNGDVVRQIDFPFGFIDPGMVHFRVLTNVSAAIIDHERYQGSDDRHFRMMRTTPGDTTLLFQLKLALSRSALYPNCGLTISLPVPFAAQLRWDARASQVIMNASPEYNIDVYEHDRLVRIIRRQIEPSPISSREALEYVQQTSGRSGPLAPCDISPRQRLENHGFASLRQVIQEVAIAPNGEIWVMRAGPTNISDGPIDLFSPSGGYFGTLPPGTPFPVVFLPDDRIGFAELDGVGVKRLVIARIERH